MAETFFAAMLVIVGFILVVIGQPLIQFIGIVIIALGVGGALFADLRKPVQSVEHTSIEHPSIEHTALHK